MSRFSKIYMAVRVDVLASRHAAQPYPRATLELPRQSEAYEEGNVQEMGVTPFGCLASLRVPLASESSRTKDPAESTLGRTTGGT